MPTPAFVDHAADRLGEIAVAHPIQNHLGDGALAFDRLEAGLEIDHLAKASGGLARIGGIGVQHERRGGPDHRRSDEPALWRGGAEAQAAEVDSPQGLQHPKRGRGHHRGGQAGEHEMRQAPSGPQSKIHFES